MIINLCGLLLLAGLVPGTFAGPSAETNRLAAGPFQPTWESLQQYQIPAWFADAKFGIWAHWGPQSAPGQGDWYAFNMYHPGSATYEYHLHHYGHPSQFGFKDIIPLWQAEKFDPDALAALYKNAGARYLVALANHHDNFDNWNSRYQPWNAVNMGPKRDILRLWQAAALKQGLRFGVSIHNINSWGWYDPARGADASGPQAGVRYDGWQTKADGQGKWWAGYDPADLYGPPHRPGPTGDAPTPAFMANWFLRTQDLIDNYQPDILEFDLASPAKMWRQWVKFENATNPAVVDDKAGMLIASHYYNRERQWHAGADNGIITLKQLPPERCAAVTLAIEQDYSAGILPHPWQHETSMGDWHYRVGDRYLPPDRVVQVLVETVCRNGNLLLNVVQKPDGTLAGDQAQTLLQVGRWLQLNGEAIYGTRPWRQMGEGPHRMKTLSEFKEQNQRPAMPDYHPRDIRFTTKGGFLYAIILAVPDGDTTIHSLAGDPIAGVELLGSPATVQWLQTPAGLVIKPLKSWPAESAVVFKIRLSTPASPQAN